MKKTKNLLIALIFLSSCIFSSTLMAQQPSYTSSGRNFKRGVAAVLFASIGGAVLGLSTLSFYGNPQEHTDNITTGALVGCVAGLAYMVYDSSRTPLPAGNYDMSDFPPERDLKLRRTSLFASNKDVPLFRYEIEF